jgi:hypothetical protein
MPLLPTEFSGCDEQPIYTSSFPGAAPLVILYDNLEQHRSSSSWVTGCQSSNTIGARFRLIHPDFRGTITSEQPDRFGPAYCSLRFFGRTGWTDVCEESFFACAEFTVVGPRLGEAQKPIWTTPDHVCVVFILPVILPKTNWANVIHPAFIKCPVATAWTLERPLFLRVAFFGRRCHLQFAEATEAYSLQAPPENQHLSFKTGSVCKFADLAQEGAHVGFIPAVKLVGAAPCAL